MNTRTTIVLLVVAIVLGGGALYVLNQQQKAAQEPVKIETKVKDLFDPKPTQVVKVRVEEPDKPARVLEKRDEKWWITSPFEARAQEYTANDEARLIADLQYTDKFEPGAADWPIDDLTGLGKANLIVTITDKDGGKHTLFVGNLRPIGQATYVRKDNDPAIYVVGQDLLERLVKPLAQYREKRVTEFAAQDATRVRVTGKQSYELVKADGKWVVEQPVKARAENEKVEELVRAVGNLYVDAFVADQPANLTIYGLAPALLQISVTTEKKEPTKTTDTQSSDMQPAESQPFDAAQGKPAEEVTTLLVGSKAGGRYFAMVDGQPSVFQIPETTVNGLDVPLVDVRNKILADVNVSKALRLEIWKADQSATIEKHDGHWHMTGTCEGPADLAAVNDLLGQIAGAKAAGFEDESRPELVRYGFDQPRGRIRVVQEGQVAPVELLIGADTPSGEMTFVKNAAEGAVAVLKKADAQNLLVDPLDLLDRSVMSFDRERAERIVVERDGRTFDLRKVGGQWRMAEPVEAPADTDAVNALLADLSNLRARKVVAAGQDAPYGLDQPEVTVAVYTKSVPATQPAATQTAPSATEEPATQPVAATQPAGETQATCETQPAGEEVAEADAAATQPVASAAQPGAAVPHEPAPASQLVAEIVHRIAVARKDANVYAKQPAEPRIYEIDPAVLAHLTAELHDRTVMNFEPSQVAAVQVPGEDGQPLEFMKKGDQWVYLPDPFFPVDPQKVTEWLGQLRGLRVERYAAYRLTGADDFGLGDPLYQVQVTLEAGQAMNLKIAKPTETGKYVAGLEGGESAFELSPANVRQLQKPLSYFKKT